MRFLIELIALLVAAYIAIVVTTTAQAEILIRIDKSAQSMTVSRDGDALFTWPVSTGRNGHATPSGSFTPFRMEAEHYSKEWDDAPMPHSFSSLSLATPFTGRLRLKSSGPSQATAV